jgi:RHS repeat-associated protein
MEGLFLMASLLNYAKTSPIPPYLYDGNLLLAETDGSDKIQKVYINDGQGIIGMVRYIYKEDGSFSHYQPLYYIFDSLGSVSLVTGEDGKALQNYKYSPYGESTNVESDPVNGLRFVGRYGGYQDDDTNLTYFWHRWYDPKDGRWLTRDPIGVKGGTNLYGYVKNNINMNDWTGYCEIKLNACHIKNCQNAYSDCIDSATNKYKNSMKINFGIEVACDISCHILASPVITPLGALVACSGSCYKIGTALDIAAEEQYDLELDLCKANLKLCLQPGQGW